ncbi:ABC-type nitrate/sulfonate/bicarbonate transport system, substrate-binding protein [Salinimicrobium sediminis]|uniref:ABC-type nitrate/sulfonate/bicarbonate transport system, substrate-binding protein n=1 Tax=Salinimicrobium sediminis TaxID=1343891 RepID=A0A285X656_9FLAO|nr:substrate-binding domain-containing protein [Salinimicrobium sediminis]SOC80274.1 ABC-type nitrate/sulfonate/bicarbonate transport system, substrate-binding protein [Salinimicrobium sediminis]
MRKIKVGGVPEHFNLPWHLGIEEGAFRSNGVDLTWRDFPDGTGAMCKALRNKEIDVAVILTEGIIKDILNGNEALIVQEYIASPLIWGVHVAAESNFRTPEDLKNQKVAISRYGSGSHLMAFVNARNMGWDPSELEFEVVGNIEGAVEALQTGKAGYFMWEHFTTKPLVDKGIFRRVADCPTPWSCFVIAVRKEFLEQEQATVQNMLKTLNTITRDFKKIPKVEVALARKYDQKVEDIEQWLKITNWSQKQISVQEIQKVQEQLFELGLIPEIKENIYFFTPLN